MTARTINYPLGAGGTSAAVRTLEDYAQYPGVNFDRYAREIRALCTRLIAAGQHPGVEIVLQGLLRTVSRDEDIKTTQARVCTALDVIDAAYGGNWRGREGVYNPAYGREAKERGVVLSTECTCDRSVARPCWAVVHEGVWSDHEEA